MSAGAPRFLVIGASGFVGGCVLEHLHAQGHNVAGSFLHRQAEKLFRFDLAADRLRDAAPRALLEGDGPLFVIIVACHTNMQECEREPTRTRAINVDGVQRLIEETWALGGTPLFTSTGSVFNGEDGYYRDDEPPSPISEYGRQKAAIEKVLTETDRPAFVARLDMIMGDAPGQRHPAADWWARLERGDDLPCIEGALLSPTFVDDIARALEAAALRGLTGLYNVVNSEFFHRDELARQFCRVVGRQGRVVNRPLASFGFADPRGLKSYLDGTRFRDATGLRFTPMREVFERFLANVSS